MLNIFNISIGTPLRMLAGICLTTWAWGQSHTPPASVTLSLGEAFSYADTHLATLQNAELDAQISEAKVKESRTKYYPTLNGSVDARYNFQRQTLVLPNFINGLLPNPNPDAPSYVAIRQGTPYTSTAGLTLTQPILNRTLRTEINYARTSQEYSRATLAKVQTDQKLEIAKAYFSVLLNEEKLRQAEADFARNEHFYQDVKVRFDNARALKTDLNKAYLNYANAQVQRQKAQDAVRTSKTYLATQVGLAPGTNLTLSDQLQSAWQGADTVFLATGLEDAMANRPEVRAESLQKELNQWQLRKTSRQYWPTLTATGYYGTLGFGNKLDFWYNNTWYPVGYVALTLNVPIFDGFQKRALAQQQALQVRKNENTLASWQQTIGYELESTQANLKNAWQNLRVQRENVAIAREVFESTNVRYQQGQSLNQEVIEAEFTLQQTQANYMQALYDFVIARLEWQKASGRL